MPLMLMAEEICTTTDNKTLQGEFSHSVTPQNMYPDICRGQFRIEYILPSGSNIEGAVSKLLKYFATAPLISLFNHCFDFLDL